MTAGRGPRVRPVRLAVALLAAIELAIAVGLLEGLLPPLRSGGWDYGILRAAGVLVGQGRDPYAPAGLAAVGHAQTRGWRRWGGLCSPAVAV